jgi:hypothetical protein
MRDFLPRSRRGTFATTVAATDRDDDPSWT